MDPAGPLEPEATQKVYRRSPTSGGDYSSLPEAGVEYSSLPEAIEHVKEDDHEAWRGSRDEKEVAGADEKEATGVFANEVSTTSCDNQAAQENSPDRASRVHKRRKWICAGIALLVVLGVGLGVGLGIGLRTGPSPSPSGSSPAFLSTRGAFNGSGIAVLTPQEFINLTSGAVQQFPTNQGNLQLFFQHHSGEIRWMELAWPYTWRGGSVSDIVATDAKNGTPISAIEFYSGGMQQWHVFYTDQNSMLRQRSLDNSTYVWTDGLLNKMNIKALDADKVGMQACFYDGPIDNVNLNGTNPDTGIRVFVATSETTFDQLAWRSGLPQWTLEQTWPNLNGQASPTCFGWARGNTSYVMFVDLQNAVDLYWRDTSGVPSTPSHPINEWTKSSVVLPDVDPIAGLSYHAILYARSAENGTIRGWNISFAAENTTTVPSNLSTFDGAPGVTNTSLTAWSIPPYAGAKDEVLVFYQTQGDDITMYSGTVSTGEWNNTSLPIPDG